MKRGLLITFAICFSAIGYSQSSDSSRHVQAYSNHTNPRFAIYAGIDEGFNVGNKVAPALYDNSGLPGYISYSYLQTTESPGIGFLIGAEYNAPILKRLFVSIGLGAEEIQYSGITTPVTHGTLGSSAYSDSSVGSPTNYSWKTIFIGIPALLHFTFLQKQGISINIFGGIALNMAISNSNSPAVYLTDYDPYIDCAFIKGGLSFELGNSGDEKSLIFKFEPIGSYALGVSLEKRRLASVGLKLGIIFGKT